jgi:hypothetical protein
MVSGSARPIPPVVSVAIPLGDLVVAVVDQVLDLLFSRIAVFRPAACAASLVGNSLKMRFPPSRMFPQPSPCGTVWTLARFATGPSSPRLPEFTRRRRQRNPKSDTPRFALRRRWEPPEPDRRWLPAESHPDPPRGGAGSSPSPGHSLTGDNGMDVQTIVLILLLAGVLWLGDQIDP